MLLHKPNGLLTTVIGLIALAQLCPAALAQWTRTNMALNAASCSGTRPTYLSKAMYNIQSMVRTLPISTYVPLEVSTTHRILQLSSTIAGLVTIDQYIDTAIADLSNDNKAKLDLFRALYGEFDPEKEVDVEDAKSAITTISDFANRMLSGLEADALDVKIFCTDAHLTQRNGKFPLYRSKMCLH
ncbi:hypothetical protein BO71DRAFT_432457 [Aspergillus ellipticus CBS 707.79]|uniref:Uncharacterized protein n=1 Tax=Aspergillus ellipticus CBS 707.79 TaxID=1448320 RepID=A0A319D341_9EURO|nr:hypothetical protein BO71DRAFT_432457 [Aspergillus ellipticus CBS 707.79]